MAFVSEDGSPPGWDGGGDGLELEARCRDGDGIPRILSVWFDDAGLFLYHSVAV